jgi:hypothetical protein
MLVQFGVQAIKSYNQFRPFCSDRFKKVCNKFEPSADIHNGTVSLCTVMYIRRWFDFVTDFFEREVDCLLSRSTANNA